MAADLRVVVLGAGVVGLSCARLLLQDGYDVVVAADVFPPHTTSDGAAAFWERRCDAHASWARRTMEHYRELLANGTATAAGVGEVSGLSHSHEAAEEAYEGFKEDVKTFRRCTAEETAQAAKASGLPFRSSLAWSSIGVDSPAYLRWLLAEVSRLGGTFVRLRARSLEELSPFAHVLVNCTGLGARELARDKAVTAYQGSVIRVHAPHLASSFLTATGSLLTLDWHATYVLGRPTSGIVTCGGTYVRGEEGRSTDADVAAAIWARCTAMVPGLLDPSVRRLHEWTGLRPGRDGDVRLEREVAAGEGGLHIVHNYGHGGCGHSLHHGCALDVLEHVRAAKKEIGEGAGPRARLVGPAPELQTAAAEEGW